MDIPQISKFLLAERGVFLKDISDAIDKTAARRHGLRSQLTEALVTTGTEISETEFFTALGPLQAVSEDLNGFLCQAGFSRETISDWLNKKSAPSAVSRAPLLQMFVTMILDYYVDVSPLHEIRRMLEERGSNTALRGGLPLDQKLETLDFIKKLSFRTRSRIKMEGPITLRELLAKSAQEMLVISNFGRKSLDELNEALMMNVGVRIGSWSSRERNHYEGRVKTRNYLNRAAAKPVPSEWDTVELKPEYKGLDWHARRAKEIEGAKLYLQAYADTELLEALKQLGILYNTQLATAPLSVIDQLCHGHERWRVQLSAMLKSTGLEFGTQVPPFLNDTVAVYRGEEPQG